MKTKIFNLIILDESGSMDCMRKQTIDGCNETINTVIAAQMKFKDTQEHFISIYAFQSDGKIESRYLIKNVPANEVKHITTADYEPWGTTPLLDAVGSTVTDLSMKTSKEELAIGSVTIITDGWENSSTHYTYPQLAEMISLLKQKGWNFNFIGANIDVESASKSLNIDNCMGFSQDTNEDIDAMFEEEKTSRMSYYERVEHKIKHGKNKSEISEGLKEASKDYFE